MVPIPNARLCCRRQHRQIHHVCLNDELTKKELSQVRRQFEMVSMFLVRTDRRIDGLRKDSTSSSGKCSAPDLLTGVEGILKPSANRKTNLSGLGRS